MNVEIEHNVSDDKLSRELWCFRVEAGYILLNSYHEQTRKTTRHKFKGPKWDSMDERSYVSALPRPLVIPTKVLADVRRAWAEAIRNVPVFIGWITDGSRVS